MQRSLLAILACCAACGSGMGTATQPDAGGQGMAVWWHTCGLPACPPPDAGIPDSGLRSCSSQLTGSACSPVGDECDPQLGCGVYLLCSTTDPTQQYGGCPVSRMRYKKDIRYLSQEELRATARDLLALPLADFRYREGDGRKHLGFMIDGHESLACVDGDRVDLYGYASMAVAAVQVQAAEIAELRAELATLRKELRKRRP